MNNLMQQEIRNDSPAVYFIQVLGTVSEEWIDDLGGMQLYVTQPTDKNKAMTTIIGELKDQAMLAGILNLMQSLGLPLLSVSCLGRPFETPNAAGS